MKNTALLTGPYDWDPALLPLTEFEARLSRARQALIESGGSAVIVHGNSIEHGALAYLTGFTPKLGPAFALVPRDGPLRILVSGGAGMIGSAKLLTWVEDVRPIVNLQNSLREWLAEVIGNARPLIGLWGAEKMAQRSFLAVTASIQSLGDLISPDERLDALRQHKSPRELTLIGETCRILTASRDAFARAASVGAGARSAALAAERAAYDQGAQDVRILASARDGGPPLALDGPNDIRCAPLLACIAVRYAGYWAEGLVTASAAASDALARAEAALNAMLLEARPGATSKDLLRVMTQHLGRYKIHPLVNSAIGSGIGLSLEEPPPLRGDTDSRLEAGGVYTIRCGATDEGSDSALVSAVIAVGKTGIDVLWPRTEPLPSNECAKFTR